MVLIYVIANIIEETIATFFLKKMYTNLFVLNSKVSDRYVLNLNIFLFVENQNK